MKIDEASRLGCQARCLTYFRVNHNKRPRYFDFDSLWSCHRVVHGFLIEEEFEMEANGMKKVLIVASLITFIFLLIAIVKENITPEWRLYQKEYAKILDKYATDDLGKMLRDNFKIEVKQIVVPQLKATDRCVSCHNGIDDPRMKNQPNPHKTHSGNILEIHSYSKYGCTICHQGQGRATVFKEAKGGEGIHWDYPLLPKELSQSGCAMCHAPDKLKETASQGTKTMTYGATPGQIGNLRDKPQTRKKG